jgi:hypothetical protein
MMKPGDRVVLWVSADGRRMARGIWGIGCVTSFVQDEIPHASNAAEVGYWLNEEACLAVTNSIDVDIPLFETPVTDVELKAAGDDLEVQRQPPGSNPSWISNEQLARLEPLLPDWPDALDGGEERRRSYPYCQFFTFRLWVRAMEIIDSMLFVLRNVRAALRPSPAAQRRRPSQGVLRACPRRPRPAPRSPPPARQALSRQHRSSGSSVSQRSPSCVSGRTPNTYRKAGVRQATATSKYTRPGTTSEPRSRALRGKLRP